MPHLLDEADAEFQRLRQEDNPYFVIKLRTGTYDFLTAEEPTVVPIHIIEARRQAERRRGVVEASATPQDFLQSIGLSAEDIRDPAHGMNSMQVEESNRDYYGNPEADAYRAYREQMVHFADDEQWLKEKTFLEGQMVYDRERLRYLESKRSQPDPGLTEPVTNFKKAFFARKPTPSAPTKEAEEL